VLLRNIGGQTPLLQACFVLPMLMPSASVVLIMKALFGSDGTITAFFARIAPDLMAGQGERFSVYAFFIWKNLGLNVLLFLAGMAQIPKNLHEASMLDGAGAIKRTRYITAPLMLPSIFFVTVYSVLQSLRVFKETYLMYGSYPDDSVYFVQTWMNNHFYKLNYQNLATGAVIMGVAIYLFVLFAFKAEDRLTKGVEYGAD